MKITRKFAVLAAATIMAGMAMLSPPAMATESFLFAPSALVAESNQFAPPGLVVDLAASGALAGDEAALAQLEDYGGLPDRSFLPGLVPDDAVLIPSGEYFHVLTAVSVGPPELPPEQNAVMPEHLCAPDCRLLAHLLDRFT